MTSPQPLLRTFLTLAVLTVLAMITLGMSVSVKAALPALALWLTLAGTYGAYRLIRTWKPVRPSI
jgi:EamA domain-containing membrane protein RarD